MSETTTGLSVLIALLAASAIGKYLRVVPRESQSPRRGAVVIVTSGLLIFAALLVGLVISDVKQSFETFDGHLKSLVADVPELDKLLQEYGKEAVPIRAELRAYFAAEIASNWPDEAGRPGAYPTFQDQSGIAGASPGRLLSRVDAAIDKLQPTDPPHSQLAASLKSRMSETLHKRQLLIDSDHDLISWPELVGATAWLSVIFAALGFSAPRNLVAQTAIVFCALSFASAIYIITDFDGPLDGAIRVSSELAWQALRHLDDPGAVVP